MDPAVGTGMATLRRLIIAFAALTGAVGVATAAQASHGESRNLGAIATIALAHGPALLALGLAGRGRALATAAVLLAGGTLLFIADLAWREWMGTALFPGAAPIGGGLMIAGWLAVVVAVLWWRPDGR
jgi:uncharacterized membrane protein YgdD (TMEM256/DUF423 family)